ncbi:putative protein SGT1 [Cocos nucifera]|nr:putative protein SGT1 [Cocos nucifera]
MATDLEARAKEAFVDDNFDLAVDLYTQALDMDPKNADLYADRAQANIKLENFTAMVSILMELEAALLLGEVKKNLKILSPTVSQ